MDLKIDDIFASLEPVKSSVESRLTRLASGIPLGTDTGAGGALALGYDTPIRSGGSSVASPSGAGVPPPAHLPDNVDLMYGYLYKKSRGFGGRKSWNRRFFRLRSTVIGYFKSETDAQPSGQFSITGSTILDPGMRWWGARARAGRVGVA